MCVGSGGFVLGRLCRGGICVLLFGGLGRRLEEVLMEWFSHIFSEERS